MGLDIRHGTDLREAIGPLTSPASIPWLGADQRLLPHVNLL